MQTPRVITTSQALEALAAEVRAAGRLALDTEFVWERTYRPVLGVVQVATADEVAVVDAVALPDLAPLFPVLRDGRVPVVLHGGTQDLEIFASLMGEPVRGVVDTQIEGAFLGYGLQVGLSALLERVLKINIKKDQTYTDWVRRPLRREQLAYAAEDVLHLLPLHDRLRADLDERGRVAWADEEMRALEEPERYAAVPAEERYEWVKGWQRLHGRDLAVLRELAAWRDRAAKRADVRPNFVANDVVLTSLAVRPVETMEDLRHVRGLTSGAVDRHGRAILAALRAGLECPAERWPERAPRLRSRTPAPGLAALLRAAVQAVAEREDIAPEVIASGREIEALASRGEAQDGLAVTRGWRRHLVGDTLLAIARGELAIAYDPERREVVTRGTK
ncbi:MAG: ribonuclease D [Deltaproteobacteria bacterium]|nr:MAG: ribonuclease D [Deltaproteobacteria bacterium]